MVRILPGGSLVTRPAGEEVWFIPIAGVGLGELA